MQDRRWKTRTFTTWSATLLALLASTASASAQDIYDTRPILREGGWSVDLVHDSSDGSLWCEGRTTNRAGQVLDITGYDNGALIAYIFDPNWNIADREIEFMVDVDYIRWTIDGYGNEGTVWFPIGLSDTAVRFLGQMQAGNAVAIMNADGKLLATFSLSGSRIAIDGLIGCWLRIAKDSGTSDPFVSASDPFR